MDIATGLPWVLLRGMNEPLVPHGFYDGPVKELAARHLALIKAVFILLLITLPGSVFVAAVVDNHRSPTYQVERRDGSRVVIINEVYNFSNSYRTQYDKDTDTIIAYNYAGFRGISKGWVEFLEVALPFLFCCILIHGLGLLFYRFFRLAQLLYPHMVFYFTALVLVPFLNVVVIFLLLRSALYQMRQMGLRVGVFGIDPARFD